MTRVIRLRAISE